MNENPETQNRVPVADLAVDACSANGATATPMTDREDKVIRHYCDISWAEKYDLMCEHAQKLERDLAKEISANEVGRVVDAMTPEQVEAYLVKMGMDMAEVSASGAKLRKKIEAQFSDQLTSEAAAREALSFSSPNVGGEPPEGRRAP